MSHLHGKTAVIGGHLCVVAPLYNLVGEPKVLMGHFQGTYVGCEADYLANYGSPLGQKVQSTGIVTGGVRKWYLEDWHPLLTTEGQPKKTWHEDVPQPRSRLEVKWTPTSATYAAPGWYKMMKRGWAPC